MKHLTNNLSHMLLTVTHSYGQLLELKLLAFLSGTLHILLFISAYCANK